MTDPEAQLRRLAESRASDVVPFSPSEIDRGAAAPVVPLARRRTMAVAAAVAAVVAIGIGAMALADDGGHVTAETAGVVDTVGPGTDTTVDGAPAEPDRGPIAETDAGPGNEGAAAHDATPTTTVVPTTTIPDVVGDDVADAEARLLDAGLEVDAQALFVPGSDARLGKVVEASAEDGTVGMVVGVLAPSLLSTDPCQRPAHLFGMFDDDTLVDRVYPRYTDDRITEIEICTGAGERVVASDLAMYRLDRAVDLDADGVDELVVQVDDAGSTRHVYALDEDALVREDEGPEIPAVDHGDTAAEAPCGIAEPELAVRGDVDGDGFDDLVAPRDGIVCLGGSEGDGGGARAIELGEAAERAEVWFMDDIEDDAVLEVFLGSTSDGTLEVRPYAIDPSAPSGALVPVAAEGCCVQTTPAAAVAADREAAEAGLPRPAARWFSCIGADFGQEAELVSGRFWIDPDAGTVQWTVDVGSQASPDRVHTMTFDDPVATDAWIPGNGCRNGRSAWAEPVDLVFGDDGAATATSIEAFNTSIAEDDPGRRVVRLREAIGVADAFGQADGPYRESLDDGLFELRGLRDDLVAGVRWRYAFADDSLTLETVVQEWSCRAGRGHTDFSPEPCG